MRRYIYILFIIALVFAGTSAWAQSEGFGGGIGGEAAFTAESAPGTTPTATGTDAIAIGDGAEAGNAASDNSVIAIGAGAVATGLDSIAIGQLTDATGAESIAIGGDGSSDAGSANATATDTLAIGNGTDAGSNRALAIGNDSQAMAVSAIALGYRVDATGANCIAIGGNNTDTDTADCSAADSVAIGQHILADDIGEFAFASGEFSTQSDAHTSVFVLRNQTTDATQTEVFADGSAGDISVPTDCTVSFRANIVGRQTNATAGAGYLLVGVIDNNSDTTALVGSVATTTIGEDVAGWDVTATADDTNDGINILVTGAVGDDVNWVARVEVVEVCG